MPVDSPGRCRLTSLAAGAWNGAAYGLVTSGAGGGRKPGSLCVNYAMKGLFRSNLSSRSEVMNLIYGSHK